MVEIAIRASEELQQERLSICKNCSNFKPRITINICDVCGCVLRMKIAIKQLKCPKGKW